MISDKENELSKSAKNGILTSIIVNFIWGIGFGYFAVILIPNSYKHLELLAASPLIATLFMWTFSLFYSSFKIIKRLVAKTIISGDRFYIQIYHSNQIINLNSFESFSIKEKSDFVTYIFFRTRLSALRAKPAYIIMFDNHRYYLCPSLLNDKSEGEEFALTLFDKWNSLNQAEILH